MVKLSDNHPISYLLAVNAISTIEVVFFLQKKACSVAFKSAKMNSFSGVNTRLSVMQGVSGVTYVGMIGIRDTVSTFIFVVSMHFLNRHQLKTVMQR